MRQTRYFFIVILSLLIVACAPVVEKKKPDVPPVKPVKRVRVEKVEEAQTLRQGPGRILTKAYVPGTFLLETAWNQGFPYNKRLPKLRDKRVVSGCVNTALAQVLYYYRYPLSARGIVTQQWNGRQLTTNLYKNYNWDIIPANISMDTQKYQIDELASLFLDLGIVNGTKFSPASEGGSGASFNTRALVENFGFSDKIKSLKSSAPGFIQTIKREIDQRRVVLLSIEGKPSGHMTVIDGYRQDVNGIKFHINMGWGGTDNDYYDLNKTITPKSKRDKNSLAKNASFSKKMTIYHHLMPCQGSDCYKNLEPEDQIHGMTIRGKFNSENDKDVYSDLFLSGLTTFSGSRGFMNQAFFVTLYDNARRPLIAKGKGFKINLSPGRYSVEVSLCEQRQNVRSCYGNNSNHLDYKVKIDTQPVPIATRKRILAKDTPPEINNTFSNMILKKGFSVHRIRIDTIDLDADPLIIRAFTNPNDTNVKLALKGNILSISPNNPVSNTTTKITIQAVSREKIATASFFILFSAEAVSFGKEFDIRGKFEGQDSQNRHKVILQGTCVIQGDNGYRSPAFFIDIKDLEGKSRYKTSVDSSFRDHFSRGFYYISSMLKRSITTKTENQISTSTQFYSYRKGVGDTYNINVVCPNFDDSISLLERDNRDIPPKIVTDFRDLILGEKFSPIHIPIETLDINGDRVTLTVRNDARGIRAVIKDGRLSLFPMTPTPGTRVKITVTASANGQRTSKSFMIFLHRESVAFGKRFEVKGKLRGQEDVQSHPIILSGQCQIKGNNGYRNQAFFTSVTRRDNSTLVSFTDKGIVQSFQYGIYYLNASLRDRKGAYYSYKPNKGDEYKIKVECSNMNATSEDIGRLLGI